MIAKINKQLKFTIKYLRNIFYGYPRENNILQRIKEFYIIGEAR